MTTSTTKTRALCVATRCTTIDQFVATFHRFCGDDETFFVATVMTRPIGLETAFAIQLADKQPVLRGLCVVLDSWNTGDNRFKRPGIRLGIKRLTVDSQTVFDRLKAASRAPAVIAEASPPPGPMPLPSLVSSVPRAGAAHNVPALPSLVAPRPAGIVVPARADGPAPEPAGPRPPALAGKPASVPAERSLLGVGAEPRARVAEGTTPPRRPSVFDAKTAPGTAPAELRGRSEDTVPPPAGAGARPPEPAAIVATPAERTTPLVVAPTLTADSTTDVLPLPPARSPFSDPALSTTPVEPVLADREAAPEARSSAPPDDAAPVGVTRFQVALHVGTIPPPVGEIEFQPRSPAPHKPVGIALDAAAIANLPERSGALVIGSPAIVWSGELVVDGAPTLPADEPATTRLGGRSGDLSARVAIEGRDATGTDLRTPGSALVLPANPLHDLSDQSLEGFVDCTIYEESGNIFHPGLDASEWLGETGERRADAVPRTASGSRSTGPVAVAAAVHGSVDGVAGAQAALRSTRAPATIVVTAAPPGGMAVPPHPRLGTVPPGLVGDAPRSDPGGDPLWRGAIGSSADALQPPGRSARDAAGSQVQSAAHAAAQLVGLLRLPRGRELSAWLRWTLIAGSTLLAIVLAFVTARVVRGPERGARGDGELPHPAPPPPPVAVQAAPPAPVPSPPQPAATAPAAPAAAASVSDDPSLTAVASVKLAARPGAGPVVGTGPCRFSIATTPSRSQIRLDDQIAGMSPLVIAASCERHKLEVSHARYQSLARSVVLSPEHPQELDISLPRPIHTVTVTSFPPGAQLVVDGRAAGTTPAVLQIVGFSTVSLTLSKPGFPSVTRKLYSKLAQDRVFVKLSAER